MARRFQFSLRALLVAMMVVAAFFSGIHVERRRKAAHYDDAIKALEAENAALRNPFKMIGRKTAQGGSVAPSLTWLQGHAEAVETRGFEGLTPATD